MAGRIRIKKDPRCPGCGYKLAANNHAEDCTMPDPDMVNSPPHYTSHPSGIEPIEITRHMNFNLGNVIKYVMRAPYKGNELQDLEKAAWYLKDEIARLKGEHDG